MARIMLYSFKEHDGKVHLDYSLTNCLVDFENHHADTLVIKRSKETIELRRSEYLNKDKVFDNGRVFFMAATKKVSKVYILKVLLEHAVERTQSRLNLYQKLLAA